MGTKVICCPILCRMTPSNNNPKISKPNSWQVFRGTVQISKQCMFLQHGWRTPLKFKITWWRNLKGPKKNCHPRSDKQSRTTFTSDVQEKNFAWNTIGLLIDGEDEILKLSTLQQDDSIWESWKHKNTQTLFPVFENRTTTKPVLSQGNRCQKRLNKK